MKILIQFLQVDFPMLSKGKKEIKEVKEVKEVKEEKKDKE